MPTGAEEAAAAKAAIAVYNLAKNEGWLGKLKDLVATKHFVLVMGSTGAGKSNFIDSLKVMVPVAIDRLNRTQDSNSKRVHVSNKVFDFYDTPGQDALRERRLKAVQKALNHEKFGVINVVSAGYHEYATGSAGALDDNNHARPEWLRSHIKVELNAAAEWAPVLTGRPAYVITLVTKADLWWDRKDEVLTRYESGRYFEVVRDAVTHGHYVLPYSSVTHRFYDQGVMSGVFETKDRTACQENLIKTLLVATAK